MQLTPDEIEVVKALISDHGSDCPALSCKELRPLAERLGVWEPELPPTAEELAQREAFAQSPLGKQMIEMFRQCAKSLAKMETERLLTKSFFDEPQWKVGDTLRIRLPKEYIVKSIPRSS